MEGGRRRKGERKQVESQVFNVLDSVKENGIKDINQPVLHLLSLLSKYVSR